MAQIPPPLYSFAALLVAPIGCYGISYDIGTRATEDDVPQGWHAHRGSTYKELINHLSTHFFHRQQYSDYVNHNITALATYVVMTDLRFISPPGKFPTTVLNIKMHHILEHAVYDATHELILGGHYFPAPGLPGPIPRGLVPGHLGQALAVLPGGRPPQYTRPSANALVAANYVV